MSKLIVGNWKMNMDLNSISNFIDEMNNFFSQTEVKNEVGVAPSFPYLSEIKKCSNLKMVSQNVSEFNHGSYTGEVSAMQLKNMGCEYVIVGHSERRRLFGENNELVRTKAVNVASENMNPIICVGETLEEKNSGITEEIIRKQVSSSVPDLKLSRFIIAYEPVWSIGTGKVPSVSEVEFISYLITEELKKLNSFENNAAILYGGSVNPSNCKEMINCANVSGLLVGGASLKGSDFTKIIELIN